MIRRFYQGLIILIVLYAALIVKDVERFCPVGGMASLAGQLGFGRMSCQMSALNIFLFLAVGITVLLAGRLFCSFLCPLGTISETLSRLGKKLGGPWEIPPLADKILRSAKYILLFFVLRQTFLSSELFCKTFDPYFAVAGGFAHEVNRLWASVAIAVLVIGAMVGRLFWCKYVCFFSAAQTTLATLSGAVVAGLYFSFCHFTGRPLAMDIFFALLCGVGYIAELYGHHLFPLVKVSRAADTCTSCGACDRACPHGIQVSTAACTVKNPDCFLCGNCVEKCPVPDTLGYKPFGHRHLAPALVLIAIIGGFYATSIWGSSSSFATVRFVPTTLVVDGENAAVFERSNVKNIHCYGSSMSFVYRLGKRAKEGIDWHEGILGVETYAASKSFRVFYNPKVINEEGIQKLIFRSGRSALQPVSLLPMMLNQPATATTPPMTIPQVSCWQVGVRGVVDDYDLEALKQRLGASPQIFGLEIEFGEPIQAKIFFNSNVLDEPKIKQLVDASEPLNVGGETLPFQFTAELPGQRLADVPMLEFMQNFFPGRSRTVKGAEPTTGEVQIYEVAMTGADDPALVNGWPYLWLSQHLTPLKGVHKIRTVLRGVNPCLWIYSRVGGSTAAEISQRLGMEKLLLPGPKETVEKPNTFKLQGEVKLLTTEEIATVEAEEKKREK